MTATALMIVGRVRKAHGIRGELLVEPITDDPRRIPPRVVGYSRERPPVIRRLMALSYT